MKFCPICKTEYDDRWGKCVACDCILINEGEEIPEEFRTVSYGDENSQGKKCLKCGKAYDLTWVVCLSCSEKLVWNDPTEEEKWKSKGPAARCGLCKNYYPKKEGSMLDLKPKEERRSYSFMVCPECARKNKNPFLMDMPPFVTIAITVIVFIVVILFNLILPLAREKADQADAKNQKFTTGESTGMAVPLKVRRTLRGEE